MTMMMTTSASHHHHGHHRCHSHARAGTQSTYRIPMSKSQFPSTSASTSASLASFRSAHAGIRRPRCGSNSRRKLRAAVGKVACSASASSSVEHQTSTIPKEEQQQRTSSSSSQSSSSAGKRRGGSGASSVSSGVRLENISKTFRNAKGTETGAVLEDVSFSVTRGERVGLVGYNGAGKTTLLRIVAGEMEADAGNVLLERKGMKIVYLTQEFEIDESRSVREEFRSASKETVEVLGRLEEAQRELEELSEGGAEQDADGDAGANGNLDRLGDLLDEMEGLRRRADALDVNKLDSAIDKMMPRLGFSQSDESRPVSSFSGGWQMRMSLGKILLQEPDLLMLDEPTNHIDVDAVEWLEGYLKEQDLPMIIVSHDRFFLDALCTKIIEIERGSSHAWRGNYSDYMKQKRDRDQAQLMAYNKQQKEIQKQNDLIKRLSSQPGQGGRLEAARRQKEELLSEKNYVRKPFVEKQKKIVFPETKPVCPEAVIISDLTHAYGENILFESTSLRVESGDRIALIGPNGAGKSTLLRMILGMEEPTSGSVALGSDEMSVGYFRQNQAEGLELGLTAFETLNKAAPNMTTSEVKALLGQFNFKGDEIKKKVSALSGGEKARLALAKFMITPAELLILDEPTNHLDIPTKEMLESALVNFNGTVIAVSHDRYFLRAIATRVVDVQDRKLVNYEGGYELYASKNEGEAKLDSARKERERGQELKQIKSKSKMSKAEKAALKKEKAKQFASASANTKKKGAMKNAKRWN